MLRYDDIIREIRRGTQNIADSAVASSQAEQRVMYGEPHKIQKVINVRHENNQGNYSVTRNQLQTLVDLVSELKAMIMADQTIQANARMELQRYISTVQGTQALAIVSSKCSIDHKSVFKHSLHMRDKYLLRSSGKGSPFWRSSRLQSSNTSLCSSIIFLKVTLRDKHLLQCFCTNLIEQLLNARITAL
jgi:hypothetical protein